MATHRWPIFGFPTLLDASGLVRPASLVDHAASAFSRHLVWELPNHSAKLGLYGAFAIPMNYASSPKLVLVWTLPTAPGGQVRFELDYRVVDGDDAESLAETSAQETVALSDGAPSSALNRMISSLTLAGANFAGKAGSTVQFYLKRDPTHADDNVTDPVLVFGAHFEFSDV